MIISWMTPLYHTIRRNVAYRVIDGTLKGRVDEFFREELRKYDGEIVVIGDQFPYYGSYVVDSLGMCEHTEIRFHDEKNYLLFLLRWT